MATNPIQRKQRNSMLGGVLIGLIIGLLVCAVVYLFLLKPNMATGGNGTPTRVLVLNGTIKSGGEFSPSNCVEKVFSSDQIPSNALSAASLDPSKKYVARIDIAAGTVLTNSMVDESGNKVTKDQRLQEYNMLALPSELSQGDYIDVRFQLPDGGDYIVVSKKRIEKSNATTVWLKMNEEEILSMSNAIVEYYIMAGSKLYADVYTNAGTQEASTPTYTPNSTVTALISENPNITSEIADGQGRFTNKLKSIRNQKINTALSQYEDKGLENLETKIEEESKSLQESREAYFGNLNAASTSTSSSANASSTATTNK